jgi:integral membrane protein (TIGR01906 family)
MSGEAERFRFVRVVALGLFYVALPLALIATNVRVAFSDEHVYKYSIDHYDVPAVTQISRSDLIAATEDIRAYFTNNQDYLRTQIHDSTGAVVPLFNPREVLHMHDVKHLVHLVYGAGTVALLYLLAYVVCVYLWAREDSIAALARRLLQACAGTVVLLVIFGAASATGGFDALFTRFHELSFGNNFWQLDPARDHLVQMFPEGFWLDATMLIAALTVLELALIGSASFLYLRRRRSPQPAAELPSESPAPPGDVKQPVG